MDRRKFLRRATTVFSAAAAILGGSALLRQIYPPATGKRKVIKAGFLQDFPVDTYTFIKDYNLFVYRDHEGVRALSARCTHLGCILERSSDGFLCPCHGSCYDESGEVISGPAPRSLDWYGISKSEDGMIYIYIDQIVDAGHKYLVT